MEVMGAAISSSPQLHSLPSKWSLFSPSFISSGNLPKGGPGLDEVAVGASGLMCVRVCVCASTRLDGFHPGSIGVYSACVKT